MAKILVTGAAGFIGAELCHKLLAAGHEVTGVDNLNDYYDVGLKKARLRRLAAMKEAKNFAFNKLDIADGPALTKLFEKKAFTHAVNLAAQAGVRHSLVNPGAYVHSNLVGFANVLEACRAVKIEHLVYASSSSVYGLNGARPYSPRTCVNHPASLYAATKIADEALAHAYSHLFQIPATGLRYFTVYGPWGRPDMALSLFTDAILNERPIKVFNNGRLRRDFTYIDDICESTFRILFKPAAPDPEFDEAAPNPATSSAPWRVYNVGAGQTVALGDFIATLEEVLGKKAIKEELPMQPGDVESTWADVKDFERACGYKPSTPLKEGIEKYVRWRRDYYGG